MRASGSEHGSRRGARRASGLVHAVLSRRQAVPAAGLPATWATALDRFAHSVHRYHDRVEVIPDRILRRRLQESGAALDRSLAAARAAGRRRAHGDGAEAVRDVLRAGTVCARAVENAVAAATARREGDLDAADRAVAAVAGLAALVAELIEGSAEPARPERRWGR